MSHTGIFDDPVLLLLCFALQMLNLGSKAANVALDITGGRSNPAALPVV